MFQELIGKFNGSNANCFCPSEATFELSHGFPLAHKFDFILELLTSHTNDDNVCVESQNGARSRGYGSHMGSPAPLQIRLAWGGEMSPDPWGSDPEPPPEHSTPSLGDGGRQACRPFHLSIHSPSMPASVPCTQAQGPGPAPSRGDEQQVLSAWPGHSQL